MQVNMRKRERTREQAAELRQMQKLFLLKAMANPGQPVSIVIVHSGQLGFGRFGLVWFGLVWFGLVWFSLALQVAEQPDLDGSGVKASSRMRQTNSKLSRLL